MRQNQSLSRKGFLRLKGGKPKGLGFLEFIGFDQMNYSKATGWLVTISPANLKKSLGSAEKAGGKLVAAGAKTEIARLKSIAAEQKKAHRKEIADLKFKLERTEAKIVGLKLRIDTLEGRRRDVGPGPAHSGIPNGFTEAERTGFKATSGKPLPGGLPSLGKRN